MNTKQKVSILLIDSGAPDAAKTRSYLAEAGFKYDLHHTETLYEGLDYLRDHPVDLVLLELNLRDSHGFKTVSTFLERAPHTPFVVVTNTNNEIIGNQSVKAGAQDYLVKTQLNSKLFCRAIRFALQRSKVQARLEKTAQELETNKKRFLEAQEMARFGTWEMDLVSDQMTWSDEVYRIFSFHPGSISPTRSDYINYTHTEDREAVEKFFDRLTKDAQQHQMEHRILLDGMNVRYLTIQGKLQVEDKSNKVLLLGTIQDITERKLSEQLIIEKNISGKTAKIQEEVLADLSFQIRTPLSSIVNLLYVLESTQPSTQQETLIGDLKTSVDDLSLSVNNLLNFSVMVSDNVKVEEEEFNIREFLQGTKNVVSIKAENASLHVALNLSEKMPEKIISDPKKLTQILYNLVDNAIKYNRENGHVIVSAQTTGKANGKAELILSVKDNGPGIDKEKMAQLLEADKLLLENNPEEQPGKKRQLGIAIVTKLVKTLGGTMEIESQPDKGSIFTIHIPVKVPLQARHLQGDKPAGPLNILLVEDHFLNQIATKKVLTNWSDFVTVDIAENGRIGVEKFRKNDYDIILMDLQMPVMDGLEATRQIREFSQVPIIALTANSNKQEQDKCLRTGMNDYLSKPFKPHELYARIMGVMATVLS